MKINIFYKRRKEANIDASDMATRLGLSPATYEEIERNLRPMPKNLMDKFFEIVKKAKDEPNKEKLEQLSKEAEINNFFDKLIEDDRKELKEYMDKFNIKSYIELSKLLGYHQSTVCQYLTKPESCNQKFKNKLFYFFNDELNIQVKKEIINSNIVSFSEEQAREIRQAVKDHGYTLKEFGDKFKIPVSTICHVLNGRFTTKKTLRKILDAVDTMKDEEFEKIEEKIIEEKTIPVKNEFTEYYNEHNENEGEKNMEETAPEITLEQLEIKREKTVDVLINLNNEIERKQQEEETKRQADEMARNLAIYHQAFMQYGLPESLLGQIIGVLANNIDNR